MSNVKNEPKYKNGILQAIRAQLEHRAFWLYLLCDEARKRGLDPRDFGSEAVKRCGLSQGKDLVKKGGTDSLKGLRKTLFTKPAQLVFEMKILESTDEKLSIDFHYCPLVKAWQNAGCTDEEIAMLCDVAMCGDHGIGECYGSVLELPKCIARVMTCAVFAIAKRLRMKRIRKNKFLKNPIRSLKKRDRQFMTVPFSFFPLESPRLYRAHDFSY